MPSSNYRENDHIKWPPYTCVACYVYVSLRRMGIYTDPSEMARQLEIKIPVSAANPFKLGYSDDQFKWGISAVDANISINRYFESKGLDLKFKHIPLNLIPTDMHEEALEELLTKGNSIGIGYDYADIDKTVSSNKHVSAIKLDQGKFKLEDFYDDSRGRIIDVRLAVIIRSSMNIGDGLWIIGRSANLNLSIL